MYVKLLDYLGFIWSCCWIVCYSFIYFILFNIINIWKKVSGCLNKVVIKKILNNYIRVGYCLMIFCIEYIICLMYNIVYFDKG